jgi:hypothetical protein
VANPGLPAESRTGFTDGWNGFPIHLPAIALTSHRLVAAANAAKDLYIPCHFDALKANLTCSGAVNIGKVLGPAPGSNSSTPSGVCTLPIPLRERERRAFGYSLDVHANGDGHRWIGDTVNCGEHHSICRYVQYSERDWKSSECGLH